MDPFSFRKLLQRQILDGTQVAYGKVGIVGGVIGKTRVRGVQDFRPILVEKGSESVLQFFL
jgi:hypothetical protein